MDWLFNLGRLGTVPLGYPSPFIHFKNIEMIPCSDKIGKVTKSLSFWWRVDARYPRISHGKIRSGRQYGDIICHNIVTSATAFVGRIIRIRNNSPNNGYFSVILIYPSPGECATQQSPPHHPFIGITLTLCQAACWNLVRSPQAPGDEIFYVDLVIGIQRWISLLNAASLHLSTLREIIMFYYYEFYCGCGWIRILRYSHSVCNNKIYDQIAYPIPRRTEFGNQHRKEQSKSRQNLANLTRLIRHGVPSVHQLYNVSPQAALYPVPM